MAVRIALDTNRYTDLCRGDADVRAIAEEALEVFLPFVVVAELRAGFAVGRHGAANERTLHRFLTKAGVSVVYADDETAHRYAAVFRQLRAQGTPIPTNDMWIAALALQHDLTLCSQDRHFDHLPQLRRV